MNLDIRKLLEGAGVVQGPRPPSNLATRHCRNLVAYDGRFYIVPQSIGPVDLAKPADRDRPGIIAFDNSNEAFAALME